MSGAFTPGLRVERKARIVRLRELPVVGEIAVQRGDTVEATTSIGVASLQGDLVIARIAEKMGLHPTDIVSMLKRKGIAAGSIVSEGQILCEHRGLFGLFHTTYRSPCAGTVEFVSERTGHVGIRLAPVQLQVKAYISGRIGAVVPGKSVEVETIGAFIQGIFGIGGERHGVLRVLTKNPHDKITEPLIPSHCSGAILYGGTAPSAAALRLAAERGSVAMIVGAVDDGALAGYLGYDIGVALTGDEPISMSLIITEGFGELPMSERTLELLLQNEGRTASVNGATQVRAGAVRPEIIVPNAESASAAGVAVDEARELAIGSRIRIIRVPYFGLFATVVDLPPVLQEIPTGATARVLRAKLQSGEVVTVPRANVELASD